MTLVWRIANVEQSMRQWSELEVGCESTRCVSGPCALISAVLNVVLAPVAGLWGSALAYILTWAVLLTARFRRYEACGRIHDSRNE
jgi:hypothetical protein